MWTAHLEDNLVDEGHSYKADVDDATGVKTKVIIRVIR